METDLLLGFTCSVHSFVLILDWSEGERERRFGSLSGLESASGTGSRRRHSRDRSCSYLLHSCA